MSLLRSKKRLAKLSNQESGYFLLTYIGHIVAGGRHTLTNVD